MRGRHDHRHAARDMVQNSVEYHVTLGVGQHELLGEVSEDAEPVRAGIDHEIDGAFLTFKIEPAIAVEHRRYHRKYALIGPPNVGICHNHPLFSVLVRTMIAPYPRELSAGRTIPGQAAEDDIHHRFPRRKCSNNPVKAGQ